MDVHKNNWIVYSILTLTYVATQLFYLCPTPQFSMANLTTPRFSITNFHFDILKRRAEFVKFIHLNHNE